jgi:acyl-coenzyme A thioesterase PaaI-like protein
MPDEPQRPHTWKPGETPPEAQRAALERLATALRTTINVVMDTDASAEELTNAASLMEQWNEGLSGRPRGRPLYGYAEAANEAQGGGLPPSVRLNSPVSGVLNPVAPPVDMRFEEGGVVATVTLGIAYEGPPGHVHGGVTSLIFDEVLGKVQGLTDRPGMTGTLTVRYRRPAPLNLPLVFRAKVDRVDGRKVYTSGTLHCGDELCAEAEGLFISVAREKLMRLAEPGG